MHFVRANALSHLNRDAEAMAGYRSTVELNPQHYRAHAGIGSLLAFGEGRLEASLEHFQRALKIDAGFAEGHRSLGVVLFDLGRTQEAIQALEQAKKLQPHPDTQFVLAQAYAKDGRREDALAAARDGIALDSKAADLRLLYGRIAAGAGRPEHAVEAFEKAVALAPDALEVRLEVLRHELSLGALDRAAIHLDVLQKAKGDDLAIELQAARMLAAKGKLDGADGALARFDAIVAADAERWVAHRYKIEALIAAKRCAEAKRALGRFEATGRGKKTVERLRPHVEGCR